MPALPFVIDTVDDSIDFRRFAPPSEANGNGIGSLSRPTSSTKTLLLAPPSVAAHEEKLRALFLTYDRVDSDLQMLDRLAAGFVSLPAAAYDVVLVLTDTDGAQRREALALLSSRKVYAALVPAMKTGATLRFQDSQRLEGAEAREAILAGLVEKDGVFTKQEEEETVVPLRFALKKKKAAAVVAATNGNNTNNGINAFGKRPVMIDLGEYNDGDELVDEDSLLTEEERNRPPQAPPECKVDGQKRRRPCKDCTCGLADRLEDEDKTRRAKADADLNVFKLKSDDLNELDFTVKGKTGSCNSCSLGDAFRCATCPYIGLPPFKPGEEVKILNGLVQL